MGRLYWWIWILVFLTGACSDSSSGPAPTPTPTPPPTPTTYSLSGRVTVSAPTTNVGIGGASLRIIDSANANRTASTDGDGNFSFSALTQAGFTIITTHPNYQDGSNPFNLTSNQTAASIRLKPNPVGINENVTGVVSGGDPTCGGFLPKPCKVHTFPIHNDGTFRAVLTWNTGSDLDLELYRGTTEIAESSSVTSREEVSANIPGGSIYELRVIYYNGSLITGYNLAINRVN